MLCPKLKLEADGGPGALWAKGLLLSPKALNEGDGLALDGDEALDAPGRPLSDLMLKPSGQSLQAQVKVQSRNLLSVGHLRRRRSAWRVHGVITTSSVHATVALCAALAVGHAL